MAARKSTIAGLMTTVLVAAFLCAALTGPDTHPSWLTWALAVAVALPWIAAPVGLKEIHRIDDWPLEAIDPDSDDLPPALAETFAKAGAGLADLGFVPVATLRRPMPSLRATAYSAVFTHPGSRELAKLVATVMGEGPAAKGAVVMLFETDLADGREVQTSNSAAPSFLPPIGRGVNGLALPEARGLGELLRAHRARADAIGGASARVDPLADGVDAHNARIEARLREHQLACGYYRVGDDGRSLVLTWKGACLGAWKLKWPVGALRLARRRRLSRRALLDLGVW